MRLLGAISSICRKIINSLISRVVSLEDVIEAFLGREIVDESDQVENLQKLAKSNYRQRLKHKSLK